MDRTTYEGLRKKASSMYSDDTEKRQLAINLIELEHRLDGAQDICELLLDKNPLIEELGIAYASIADHITKAKEVTDLRKSFVPDLE